MTNPNPYFNKKENAITFIKNWAIKNNCFLPYQEKGNTVGVEGAGIIGGGGLGGGAGSPEKDPKDGEGVSPQQLTEEDANSKQLLNFVGTTTGSPFLCSIFQKKIEHIVLAVFSS